MKLFKFDLVSFYCSEKLSNSSHYNYTCKEPYRHAVAIDTEKDQTAVEKKAIDRATGKVPLILDVNNEFENLEIVSFEYLSSGGKRYNVKLIVDNEILIVTLRDKVFEYCVLNLNIKKGKLSGKWRYINESGALLVPIGSPWDIKYSAVHNSEPLVKVKNKDLVPGNIYKTIPQIKNTKLPSFCIYLGTSYKEDVYTRYGRYGTSELKPIKVQLFLSYNAPAWQFNASTNYRNVDFDYLNFYFTKTTTVYEIVPDAVEKTLASRIKSMKTTVLNNVGVDNNSILRATSEECKKEIEAIIADTHICPKGGYLQYSALQSYLKRKINSGTLQATSITTTWV
jgi:hypothetical protein